MSSFLICACGHSERDILGANLWNFFYILSSFSSLALLVYMLLSSALFIRGVLSPILDYVLVFSCHYVLPSHLLPSLWRSLRSGSTYGRDLLNTKVPIYLTWDENLTCFFSLFLCLPSNIYFIFICFENLACDDNNIL